MTDVYISGSLRHIPRERWGIYENIGKVVESFGLKPYIPHIHTPQNINHTVDTIMSSNGDFEDGFHKDIFHNDILHVENSKLVIAEVSNPSLGSGIELGVALKIGKPIICLARKNAVVTSLVRGAAQSGMMQIIRYETEEDALSRLKNLLETKFTHLLNEV